MIREFKRILVEGLLVVAFGLAFGLVANLVSPRGLSLSRNYFPDTVKPGTPANSNGRQPMPGPNSAGQTSSETVAARLKEKGLQPIDGQEAIRLMRDPQYEQELIVFVDARDDRHYQEGHVPGAYQFDRYYPEKHLPTVLPVCLNALKVVVYCTGGNCEDSEFAALALKEAGVQQDRLFVYAGGMTDWATNGVPVEVGGRRSGTMRDAKP
jgi:rhodanese-related sulfurtransferase